MLSSGTDRVFKQINLPEDKLNSSAYTLKEIEFAGRINYLTNLFLL